MAFKSAVYFLARYWFIVFASALSGVLTGKYGTLLFGTPVTDLDHFTFSLIMVMMAGVGALIGAVVHFGLIEKN